MKTTRLLTATAVSLAALTALMCVLLALAWGQPQAVRASRAGDAPSAPLTLSPPYLSDANAADAPYGPAPAVDGVIAPGEYAIAHKLAFPTYGGDLQVFIRQDAITLYIAFDSADTAPFPTSTGGGTGPAFQVFLDTQHNGGASPQTDDYKLNVLKNGLAWENQGDGIGWSGSGDGKWTVAIYTTTWGWQGEFAIALSKLGITQTGPISIGLALAEVWTPSWPQDWYWPSTGFYNNPSTWGHLGSSSEWGTFYWKPGPWQDYALSGMPDLDQMQVGPTYCGPFAAANSLWWFDSKFEPRPVGPPGGPPSTIPISDSYTLVKSYDPSQWDDHDPRNVVSLTVDLGKYFGTDTNPITGTHIYSMYSGIQSYLRDHGLWDDYLVTLVNQPEFTWVADEVMRSEDVILLLGFWQEQPPGSGHWVRISGHYVTVAGVDKSNLQIAFSDPAQDSAEAGGSGRVLSGTLLTHYPPHPGPDSTVHNDVGNVSHDIYAVLPGSPSPGGSWWIPGYEPPGELLTIPGLNPNPKWTEPPAPWTPGPLVHTEIEYALTVSPYTWKASGQWAQDQNVALYHKRFDPYQDFAPSGAPDFDQRQDNWVDPTGWWSFCGPTAAADSLWWFDSKFVHHSAAPPVISDTYPLVQSYGLWDDHDPQNVDNLPTPWPPLGWPLTPPITPGAGEFIEDLALYFHTDQVGPGTIITDVHQGLQQYLTDHDLRPGYVITQMQSPDFWWVAEQVERSEDVILLLGFYVEVGGFYERVGGHYVTVPGVDKQGGLVAFSDPYWDRMESVLPSNEFVKLPLWTGRVGSDGDPPMGASGLVPTYTHSITHTGVYTLHNDAANISHDVYYVTPTNSPGGIWGPQNYIQDTSQIVNFAGMNGGGIYPGSGRPVQTEVEWAVAISPMADVWITKTVTPSFVTPGEWVTFTLIFGNAGNTAEGIAISDALDSRLINASYTYTLNYSGVLIADDTFTWTVGTLHWNEGGLITITAQVDAGLGWPSEIALTNTAAVTTTTQEQYQVKQLPDSASASFQVQTADLGIAKSVTPTGTLFDGDWLTFTLVYSNVGPAPATSVVITDLLSPYLLTSTASFTYATSYGGLLAASDHIIWQAGTVPAGGWGIITVTVQISNAQGVSLTNQALIGGWFDRDWSNNQAMITMPLPLADVWVAKTVTPALVTPGDWLTFSIAFGNATYAADDVVVSDVLDSRLTNASYTYTLNYLGSLVGHDTFTWTVGTLLKGQGGFITVTAQMDPASSWPAMTMLTNTVEITTTTAEQTQRNPLPDVASTAFIVQTADLGIRKTVLPTGTLSNGEWMTFTLVYSNGGPAPASDVVITDLLCSKLLTATASFTFTTSYGGQLIASDHYIWQADQVPSGGWGMITVTAQISGALGASSLTNQALISGWFDRDPANNQTTLAVPLSGSTIYLPVAMKQ